jgi:ABC-type polysaccharide transport system permease subunit
VYKITFASGGVNFSYPSAIGLFQSVVGFVMVLFVNALAKRVSDTSLW